MPQMAFVLQVEQAEDSKKACHLRSRHHRLVTSETEASVSKHCTDSNDIWMVRASESNGRHESHNVEIAQLGARRSGSLISLILPDYINFQVKIIYRDQSMLGLTATK
jgi:hypothetical protein